MLQLVCWLALAAIHVIPALALVRPALLTRLYGLSADHPLFLLLQHRAALFLAVVVVALLAAFDPASRRAALLVVAISMVSFLALYWQAGSPAPLRTIARVDLVGLLPLLVVAIGAFRA